MIEVLKQALEALENGDVPTPENVGKNLDAITAIKEALAQPEQEPVFWYKSYPNGMYNGPIHNAQIGDVLRGSEEWIPLYTTPPQRTWQGLTDEEIKTICLDNGWDSSWQSLRFAQVIEAKLKERNI